jgi:hypothetical protein
VRQIRYCTYFYTAIYLQSVKAACNWYGSECVSLGDVSDLMFVLRTRAVDDKVNVGRVAQRLLQQVATANRTTGQEKVGKEHVYVTECAMYAGITSSQ